MKIQFHEITVRDLVAGCHDDGEGGYGGALEIAICQKGQR